MAGGKRVKKLETGKNYRFVPEIFARAMIVTPKGTTKAKEHVRFTVATCNRIISGNVLVYVFHGKPDPIDQVDERDRDKVWEFKIRDTILFHIELVG